MLDLSYSSVYLFVLKFDHRLFADNLMNDLQTTVTRTAEHLNSANSTKTRDVQFLSPSNTTTVVEERPSSPGGVSNLRMILIRTLQLQK